VEETLDDIILKSFKDCISALTTKYGSNLSDWKWGDVHRMILKHPLGSVKILDRIFGFNSDEFKVGGSDHTVCAYSGLIVDFGPSERHILNTANWDESLTVIPTGESGIPASEFYLSQIRTYTENGFYKDAFSDEAVRKAAKYTLRLVPGR